MEWEELRAQLQSISDADKSFHDRIAEMAEEIFQRRSSLGLTQADVARRADLKQPAVARLENSTAVPRLDTLMKVADVLGLDITLVPREQSNGSREMSAALAR